MNRSRVIIALTLTAIAFALAVVGGCDKGVKQVRIRYKYVPGMELDYRLKLAGPSKEYSDDSLVENVYVEATEDFSWLIRRVLEDSTAEIRFTGNWISDRWQVTDSTKSDSAIHHESAAPEFLRYAKPDGKTVDIQLLSDTSYAEEAYLRHHFEQSYAIFPEQPIGPGYTWTQSTKVILPKGPTEATATYIVKGYDRVGGHDCVIIEYDVLAIIPLVPRTSEGGQLIEGVHRIRSVGDLSFAYRQGYEVQVKERWTLNGEYQFIKKGTTDTAAVKELVEYDVEADLTDVKQQ